MERVCVYPGSFDPITIGHMDIIRRSTAVFDRVVVAVLHNPAKAGCFPVGERLALIRSACADLPQVSVESFGGLLVDFCKSRNIHVVVRGLRAVSDFENELQMAQVNRQLLPELETIFMMTRPEHAPISSSVVREFAHFGGDYRPFIPEGIYPQVQAFFEKRGK